MGFIAKKLLRKRIWKRIALERLSEPLHVNLLSAFVAIAGSFRARVAHDLVVRPHNAFAILQAADQARSLGIETLSLLEFGVAAGAGLMNMARIAEQVTAVTGVRFKIYGFDTGAGMPPAVDYRDHPDLYAAADFPMNQEALRARLPANVSLVIGNVATTTVDFMNQLPASEPVGYVVFDLDYYSSTVHALRVLSHSSSDKYLPLTVTYFDDVYADRHNHWCGELLAIDEFNAAQPLRKLEQNAFLEQRRIFRRAQWIKQMYYLHVLDHASRSVSTQSARRVLSNPYL